MCTKLSHGTYSMYPAFVMHMENENAAHNSSDEGKNQESIQLSILPDSRPSGDHKAA